MKQGYKRNRPRQGESQRLQILQWNAGWMSQDKKIQVQKILQTYDYKETSTRWGYKDTNIACKEIEDILNSNPLELIYSNEDPVTYLHYNRTRTTPDLLLSSSDISEHTPRKIIDDPGSGHKPVVASITIGSKSMAWKVPTKLSWNFKKTDWPRLTNLLDNELHTSPLNFNQHPDKLCTAITNIMIRCAKKTIPRGKTKHYRVSWSKHLEKRKIKRDALRNTADQTGRTTPFAKLLIRLEEL
ncbi:unnamed protein product [Rodentolepis nana]|uniref:Endonuclease/exonuclease/phosphatase domain-containing protein n=1 Tax=Rodentolepis nana TaxID=102285 RepID=A0A3P7SJW3_RODNA|nr:unnamed protein product [Rodentolepis nana]